MIQVVSPKNKFGPIDLDLYLKYGRMNSIVRKLRRRKFVLIRAMPNYNNHDWNNSGIKCVLTFMLQPLDGTLFRTEDGSEWNYLHEIARIEGHGSREMLLQTLGLLTTDYGILL